LSKESLLANVTEKRSPTEKILQGGDRSGKGPNTQFINGVEKSAFSPGGEKKSYRGDNRKECRKGT